MKRDNLTQVFQFIATTEDNFSDIGLYSVPCGPYTYEKSVNASPLTCGVAFTDEFLSPSDVYQLILIITKLMDNIAETTTTNRESLNLQWINLHNIFRKVNITLFTEDDYEVINRASKRAKKIIAHSFGIPEDKLYLTTVSQFTKYEPITKFSEFRHIDKVRTPELVVTSILWLSTVNKDFDGGRLEFLNGFDSNGNITPDVPILIEPKKGRFAAWTSGYENPHSVHEILWGTRNALIFAFTAKKMYGHSSLDDLRTWAALNKPTFYY